MSPTSIVELRVKCIHPDGAIEIETVVKENPLAIERERALAQRKHWPAANLAVANTAGEGD